jgi:hypothetical protein
LTGSADPPIDVLDIAQLSAVFESYESLEEAVQSF